MPFHTSTHTPYIYSVKLCVFIYTEDSLHNLNTTPHIQFEFSSDRSKNEKKKKKKKVIREIFTNDGNDIEKHPSDFIRVIALCEYT